MARGDRREPIVFDDQDRATFVRTLASACKKSGWEVFAWVLMDNHDHLAIRTPAGNLVEGMQRGTRVCDTTDETTRMALRKGRAGSLCGKRCDTGPEALRGTS